MKSIIAYLKGVRFELSKVTWPKRDEIIKLTLIIFIISAILGIYLGLLDYTFIQLMKILISS